MNMDLTVDQLDAILRDPQVPPDVRAAAQTELDVRTYLNSVDFSADDNGFFTVSRKDPTQVGPIADAPASSGTGNTTPAAAPGDVQTVADQVASQVADQVAPQVADQVAPQVADQVTQSVHEKVDAILSDAVSSVHAKVDEALADVHAKVDTALAQPDAPPPDGGTPGA